MEAAQLISVIVCAAPLTADHEEDNWPRICTEEGEYFRLLACLPASHARYFVGEPDYVRGKCVLYFRLTFIFKTDGGC